MQWYVFLHDMCTCIWVPAGQALIMCHVLNMRRCQVLRLDPGTEQRLLALLHGRILPVAQKSLRLWKRGVTRSARGLLTRCKAACFGCSVKSFTHTWLCCAFGESNSCGIAVWPSARPLFAQSRQ